MEPIIRAAPVSGVTRQLYRGAGRQSAVPAAGLPANANANAAMAGAAAGFASDAGLAGAGAGAAPDHTAPAPASAGVASPPAAPAAPHYGAAKPAPVSAPLQAPAAVVAAAQAARPAAALAPAAASEAARELASHAASRAEPGAEQMAARPATEEAERRQTALLAEKQLEKQAELARQEKQRALEAERLAKQAALEAAALADAERRGYAQGQEQAAAEHRAQAERLASALAGVAQSRDRLVEQSEEMLVEIAYAAVCRMVGDTVTSRAAMAAMVNRLAQETRADDQLCVRLHPQDVELLRQPDGAGAAIDARIVLQGDATVQLGGYLLDSARGLLDARLDFQLLQLRERLLQVRQSRRTEAEAASTPRAAP